MAVTSLTRVCNARQAPRQQWVGVSAAATIVADDLYSVQVEMELSIHIKLVVRSRLPAS